MRLGPKHCPRRIQGCHAHKCHYSFRSRRMSYTDQRWRTQEQELCPTCARYLNVQPAFISYRPLLSSSLPYPPFLTLMSSLICVVCLECLKTKTPLCTTCGHILCSECAVDQFMAYPVCPVCRRGQTFEQLIRLFPTYGTESLNASSDAASSSDIPQQTLQISYPQPHQNSASSSLSPGSSRPSQSVVSRRFFLDITSTHFPWAQAGPVPARDYDGSPVFLGLAAFKNGVHPCRIRVEPQGRPVPYVSYGGKEYLHEGSTLLLPFDPAEMEWVITSHAQVPEGRRPVEGGYECRGTKRLFHARAVVKGVTVPGKAGEHGHMVSDTLLGRMIELKGADWYWVWQCGANVPYGGKEHVIVSGYEVL